MMISSKIKSYVSVVTATYNRAHLLSRSFKSLVEGELHPLEWIIIDDGSTDNTEEVVSEFVKESPFPIVYRKKENGGVHTAVNVAFGLLEGELFVKLDSDDWRCSDAIKRIQEDWDALSEEEKKKEQRQKNQREAIALGLQLFNLASEKADTRNWQSLPHTIHYVRIPLQAGENKLTLTLRGTTSSTIEITVPGKGGLQFRNKSTFW